jgi:excinuclease UvrABC nuclease subunit
MRHGQWLNLEWNHITIHHVNPINLFTEREKCKSLIGIKGVYIYVNKFEEILYIGQGNIGNRFDFHLRESMGIWTGNGCIPFIKFFSSYAGNLNVYWVDTEEINKRRMLKARLISELNPLFEVLKKRGY